MKTNHWIMLFASVTLGVIWVFAAQRLIFLNLFAGLLVGPGLGMNLENYLQFGSSPAFYVLWAGCISALLIWMGVTWSAMPRSSAQVRMMQPMWWIAAVVLSVFGWLCLGWFTIFSWQVRGLSPLDGSGMNYYPVPLGGWILLMGFVILDVVLLFWLPTVLASPRTYRLVVPGAVTLLGNR